MTDQFDELFFINVGTNIASKISPSNKNFHSYLPLISKISDENSVTEVKLKSTFFVEI